MDRVAVSFVRLDELALLGGGGTCRVGVWDVGGGGVVVVEHEGMAPEDRTLRQFTDAVQLHQLRYKT